MQITNAKFIFTNNTPNSVARPKHAVTTGQEPAASSAVGLVRVDLYLVVPPPVGQVPSEFLDSQSFDVITALRFLIKPLKIVETAYYTERTRALPTSRKQFPVKK